MILEGAGSVGLIHEGSLDNDLRSCVASPNKLFVYLTFAPASVYYADFKALSGISPPSRRVLALRILHFHHLQLHFECREFQSCESFPTGLSQ